MKTIEQVIKEVIDSEHDKFELLLLTGAQVEQIAKRYARAALEKAANEATLHLNSEMTHWTINKSSITDIELP